MRVRKVKISGFGRFAGETEVDFDTSGIAVVLGPNESGKSTLMKAITGTLFGLKNEELMRPWQFSGTFACQVQMIGADGRVVSVRRDFNDNAVRVTEDDTVVFDGVASPRGRSAEKERYDDWLGSLLGIKDPDLFFQTVCVRQGELKTEFDGKLQGFISGSRGANALGILEELENQHFALTVESPWGTTKRKKRRIEETREVLRAAQEVLATSRRLKGEADALETDMSTLESENARLESEASSKESFLDDVAALNKSLAQEQQLKARIVGLDSELEEIERHARRVSELESWLAGPDYARFAGSGPSLRAQLAALRDKERRAEELSAQVASEEREYNDAIAVRKRTVAVVCGLVGLAVGGLSGLFLGIASVVVASVLALVCYLTAPRLTVLYGNRLSRQAGRLDHLSQERDSASKEIQTLTDQLASCLGGERPEAVLTLFDKYQELRQESETERRVLDSLYSRDSVQECKNAAMIEMLAVRQDTAQVLERQSTLKRLSEDSQSLAVFESSEKEKLDQAKAELAHIKRRLEEKRRDYDRKCGETASLRDEAEIEEEIEETTQSLERLEFRRDALRAAVDALAESVEVFRSTSVDAISQEVSKTFRQVAGEHYTRIIFDDKLNLKIAGEANDDIPLDSLSAGARDQLYFAMRLAFADEVSRGRTLPLILDDPFGSFDTARLEAARAILEEIAAHRQVMLFSHDQRFAGWGKVVCSLG